MEENTNLGTWLEELGEMWEWEEFQKEKQIGVLGQEKAAGVTEVDLEKTIGVTEAGQDKAATKD